MRAKRFFLLLMLLTGPVSGASAEIDAEQIADGIYVLYGQGGNIGAVIGDDGIFLIDDQVAPLTDAIRSELESLPDARGLPVRFVLNTHFHADHTGGNENLGEAGAVIVAHDNVRVRMSTDAFRENFLEYGGEDVKPALPVVTFNDRVTFHVNGHTLATRHYPQAHTDGDSVVSFMESNVVHMGDIYFQVGYPFIDMDNGGSVQGVIDAVESVIANTNDETVIVPGHGKVSNRKELREYRDMLLDLRDAVSKPLHAGRSLDEIKAMNLSAPYDERWSWQFISGERFIETLYRDLGGARHKHHHDNH